MLSSLLILSLVAGGAQGATCKDLKKEFPEHKISRKPLASSNGTCNLSRTCCRAEVEAVVKQDTVRNLRQVVSNEVNSVRAVLKTIKDMTAVQMMTMIDELVPADAAELLDVQRIGEVIWQYTLGNITAYELTVEVAVIGSSVLFTDKAAQDLLDMTECIIRELGKHATQAFQQIAAIVENVLEAPRTFGMGFEVVDILLDSIDHFDIPSDCSYDQLVGCPRCGVKMPHACRSLCSVTATHCLESVYKMAPLWASWIDSVTSLVDAMVLMKDIQINPNEFVTPELIEELTNDIMSSMVNVNFKQCKTPRSKRSAELELFTITQNAGKKRRRSFSEGELIKTMLVNYFSTAMTGKACRGASSDTQCWLGDTIGDYDADTGSQAGRATKSYSQDTGSAAMAINNYRDLVDNVISNIHAKVRAQRDSAPVPAGYTMFSSSVTGTFNHNKLLYIVLLVTVLLNYVPLLII